MIDDVSYSNKLVSIYRFIFIIILEGGSKNGPFKLLFILKYKNGMMRVFSRYFS